MGVKIYTSPEPIQTSLKYSMRLFLGGSIEMGKARDWQAELLDLLDNKSRASQTRFKAWSDINQLAIYNPRRTEWDSSWKQEIANPAFYQQVDWELNALEESTRVLIYLAANTISPISLLELGLFTKSGKLDIICEKEFHRRGNIEVVSEKYKIPLYDNLESYLFTNSNKNV